jgi:DNA recombination protein RmuC
MTSALSPETILGVVVGLLVGMGIGVAWCVARSARRVGAVRVLESRLSDARAALSQESTELREASDRLSAAETARAVAVAELELLRTTRSEVEARAEEDRARLLGAFAQLSSDALAKNNEQFLALADSRLGAARAQARGDLEQRRDAIERMLEPLVDTLGRYERGVQEMERERQGAYAGLTEKVAQLHSGHEQLQRETRNLVTALRSPQTRGRWGEVQLRRVAEMAGMVAHCDFDEQVSTTSPEDVRRRPDMVVHLPGGGEIVVDAKVPLEAFLQLLDADDDHTRAQCQARHAKQVRTHVDQLAKKEYWKQFDRSPHMVVAFIPGDQLLAAAFEKDPGLQEHAMANGVLVATPVTLIALLRTVALGWQQETIAESAREVQRLGAELYDRLRTMSGHLQGLQRTLTASVEAYNKVVGSFETRVLVSARRFPGLGVGPDTEEIPELATVEATPRRLQAVAPPVDGAESGQSTIFALGDGGVGGANASTG